ncbi:MAG: hypothetical protein WCR67_01225 [Bacilli bacterium]
MLRNRIIGTAIMSVLAVAAMASCTSTGSSRTTLSGSYHIDTPINEVLRGCDLNVILNNDKSIYTIALDDASEYTCPDMQVLWSIKSSGYFINLGSLGISGIKALDVDCGENGLPTKINGMSEEWLVPMNSSACGLVVLALQDAFTDL